MKKYRIFERILNEQVVYGATDMWRQVDEIECSSFEEARKIALKRNPQLGSITIDDSDKTRIDLPDIRVSLEKEEI